MVDELQGKVRETSSLVSTSDMEVGEPNVPIPMQDDADLTGEAYYPQNAVVNKLVDEVFATVKDDRIDTKKAISAVIASTAKVQNQNDRVIGVCERELRRHDLTEEQRTYILNRMFRAAESTVAVSDASRKFQQKQLEHLHKLPFILLAGTAVVIFLGLGGRAIIRTAA